MRILISFFVLLMIVPVARAQQACNLDPYITDQNPYESELCKQARASVATQNVLTLQLVLREAQLRELARYLRDNPDAQAIGDFVYDPVEPVAFKRNSTTSNVSICPSRAMANRST